MHADRRTYIYFPLDKRYSPIISTICGLNNNYFDNNKKTNEEPHLLNGLSLEVPVLEHSHLEGLGALKFQEHRLHAVD